MENIYDFVFLSTNMSVFNNFCRFCFLFYIKSKIDIALIAAEDIDVQGVSSKPRKEAVRQSGLISFDFQICFRVDMIMDCCDKW